MEIIIRATEPEDAEHYQRIFGHPDVYFNTLQRPCPSHEMWCERLKLNKTQGHIDFVAEIDGKVVGTIALFTYANPRRRHAVAIGIGVDAAYFGKGVGSKLMAFIIDYAFNWLGCIRIELEVFADNEKAIALYNKFGFEAEGIRCMQSFRNGQYCDVMGMALINSRFA
ncbi:GNAT family N-acetyltransferase [Xenorhabdus griffiniae]|uniref:GNAT family N-acetyltransferase n=1 Tax=Xenorhabdus griffiniae TaxID=351672 RepID=A0ABY9XM31_9GAMM|nr:GNAT family N-acetyltransferase [Xenorhabdus griffiniae]MBD1229611.1 GNAT family N-acetyltransferase [Xenorhabdus griffiniae]WMV73992.1 GNAT family N-acetyltransferase [Xenorhabdus griffiniae]WNH03672.1 GNAT family N-acetyltransferase [Xenorhabdus griffiniae]